jgi:hypothetical protein
MSYVIVIIITLIVVYLADKQWKKMRDLANENGDLSNKNAKIADGNRDIAIKAGDLIDKLDKQLMNQLVIGAEAGQFIYKISSLEAAMSKLLYEYPNKKQQAAKWLNILDKTPDLSWFLEDICVQAGTTIQKLHTDSNAKKLVINFLETTPISTQLDNSQTMRRFGDSMEKSHIESDKDMEDVLNAKEQLGLIEPRDTHVTE